MTPTRIAIAVSLLFSAAISAATLPGFRVEQLGTTAGFASSIVTDSRGTIYYTATAGTIYRFAGGTSTPVAHVTTDKIGNSGLLGMALLDDNTAVVHYTTPKQTDDVVSKIDLTTGQETIIAKFVGDITFPGREVSAEHHGGNPIVASDGSIFVGIGEYGGGEIAALPEWNGGKIWRIFPNGGIQQFARGFRNPFDMVWDGKHSRLILCDNGPDVDDEIDLVTEGGYYGWPFTVGTKEPVAGAIAPIYTFNQIVAPTGMVGMSGLNSMIGRGLLIGSFVTASIYYVRDVDASPLPDPLPLIQGETGPIIDVTEGANGEIYFVSGSGIYHLVVPQRGDCNGDGKVDANDLVALQAELLDGGRHAMTDAQNGTFRGSWGCDVNADGFIDDRDMTTLTQLVSRRSRAVHK